MPVPLSDMRVFQARHAFLWTRRMIYRFWARVSFSGRPERGREVKTPFCVQRLTVRVTVEGLTPNSRATASRETPAFRFATMALRSVGLSSQFLLGSYPA